MKYEILRLKRTCRLLWFAGVLFLVYGVHSAHAGHLTYQQVDYVTVQDFSAFEAIWTKAQTQNVRLAMFGDSQETSPGGAGRAYIPRLNYEFFQHFGKVGESFTALCNSSYGGMAPAAEWLQHGSPGSALGVSPSSLTSQQVLPGMQTARFNSSAYGQLTMLDPFNSSVDAGAGIRNIQVWDNTQTLTATIFARQFAGSDEIAWRASPTNGTVTNFFLPNSASGTTTMGLNSSAGQIVSQEIGPLPWDGKLRQQLVVTGSGATGADIVGVRFQNADQSGGVCIQDFAAGGYRTTSFLDNHAESGPMLAALGPWDALIIHTGANDAYGGVTADAFKANLQTLIDAIRSAAWLNNPNQKFILITEAYYANGLPHYDAEFDQYAGVMAELAMADPNIMAINSRRWSEELGFNKANFRSYLMDDVHYTPLGAQTMAYVDSYLMLHGGIIPEPSVMALILTGLVPVWFRSRRRRA